MTSNVIPFGKYKGQPVEDMLADRDYMAWVEAQPWFRERYLHLLSRRDADAASRTPVHNKLQTLFLDEEYRLAFVSLINPDAIVELLKNHLKEQQSQLTEALAKSDATDFVGFDRYLLEPLKWSTSVAFETNGGDVVIRASVSAPSLLIKSLYDRLLEEVQTTITQDTTLFYCGPFHSGLIIEIKPTVADEYPAILRQMERNKSDYLFVERYEGEGATQNQFVAIFAASGKRVVFKRDVDRAVAETMLARLDAAGIGLILQPSGKVTVTPGPQPAPELLASAQVYREPIIALLLDRARGAAAIASPVQDDTL